MTSRLEVATVLLGPDILLPAVCATFLSSIAGPLYSLTRKDTPYELSPECEATFVHLKGLLTQSPVLAYPHFGRDFLIETMFRAWDWVPSCLGNTKTR